MKRLINNHFYFIVSLIGCLLLTLAILLWSIDFSLQGLGYIIKNAFWENSCNINTSKMFPFVYMPINELFNNLLNSDSFLSAFISCIAAVDGVILTLGVSISLERLANIKTFFRNSSDIVQVINSDRLLKIYPWMVVFHLFFTFMMFFECKNINWFILFFLINSLYVLIVYLFAYFKRIEEYASFRNLNIKNSIISKAVKKYYKELDRFIFLVRLIRDIIFSVSIINVDDKRLYKYSDNLVGIYKRIFKNISKENYKKTFLIKQENGYTLNYASYILRIFMQIYEHSLRNENVYLKLNVTEKITEMLPYSTNEEIEKKQFGYENVLEEALGYLVKITKYNLDTYEATLSLDRKFLLRSSYQWFFTSLKSPKLRNHTELIVSNMAELLFYAIDKNNLIFINDFVEYIYDNTHYCFYSKFDKKFNLNSVDGTMLLFAKIIQYALFVKKFDVIAICLKKEKVNNGGFWTFSPYPNNIYDWLKLCEPLMDSFVKIKNAYDGHCLWRQVLVFLIIKQVLTTQYYSKFTNPQKARKELIGGLVKKDYNYLQVTLNTIKEILKTELDIVLTNAELLSVLFKECKIDTEYLKKENFTKSLIDLKCVIQKEISYRESVLIDVSTAIEDIEKWYHREDKISSTIHNLIKLDLWQDSKLVVSNYNGFKKEYEKRFFLSNEKNLGFRISSDIFEHNNKIIGKYLYNQLFNNKKLSKISIEDMKELILNTKERYIVLTNYHYMYTKEIEKDLGYLTNEDEIQFGGAYELNSHLSVCLIHSAQLNIKNPKSLILINDRLLFSRVRQGDKYISIDERDKQVTVNLYEHIKIKKLPGFVAYRII